MQIHTVREGESIFHIARQYNTSALTIITNNALSHPDRLVVGEELLILMPTRTHRVRGTETLTEIATRYEIRPSELIRNNPDLRLRPSVRPGQLLVLKYPPPKGGMSAGLGYVRGASKEALDLALPYLSYFVFDSCHVGARGDVHMEKAMHLEYVLKKKKTPLLRIDAEGISPSLSTMESVAEAAIREGYYGLVLGDGILTHMLRSERDAYLLAVRRIMLGKGLILFVEGDLECDFGDYADGNILLPHAMWRGDMMTDRRFDLMEKTYESAKTFLGLPSKCTDGNEEISYAKMREIGYKCKAVIKSEENGSGTLSYRRYRCGVSEERRIRIPTPEYLSRLIGYLCEYGMMGAALYIEDVPTFLWMLLHTSLWEADYALSLLSYR